MADAGSPRTHVADGVVRVAAPGTRWLHAGHDGGYARADAAYNVSVPEGFDRTDLAAYAVRRRERAGFADPGPSLLTGVDARHARGAHSDPVTVVATAGVSNPAALPTRTNADDDAHDRRRLRDDSLNTYEGIPETHDGGPVGDGDPVGNGDRRPGTGDRPRGDGDGRPTESGDSDGRSTESGDGPVGTVNLLVWTDRALSEGVLASLLGVVVEAKTATLLARTGFPGTTTDAVVVGCDPDGERAAFAGSGTAVGAAARACVREAVTASLDARYADTALPGSVAEADYGVATTRTASVFEP